MNKTTEKVISFWTDKREERVVRDLRLISGSGQAVTTDTLLLLQNTTNDKT